MTKPDSETPRATHDSLEQGQAMRRRVMGAAYVDSKTHDPAAFDAPYQDYITRHVWGGVWPDEGLSVRERHMVTLAILAVLGRERELAGHLRATANTGISPQEVQQILLQVTAYAGAPVGGSAFTVAKEVLGAPTT